MICQFYRQNLYMCIITAVPDTARPRLIKGSLLLRSSHQQRSCHWATVRLRVAPGSAKAGDVSAEIILPGAWEKHIRAGVHYFPNSIPLSVSESGQPARFLNPSCSARFSSGFVCSPRNYILLTTYSTAGCNWNKIPSARSDVCTYWSLSTLQRIISVTGSPYHI